MQLGLLFLSMSHLFVKVIENLLIYKVFQLASILEELIDIVLIDPLIVLVFLADKASTIILVLILSIFKELLLILPVEFVQPNPIKHSLGHWLFLLLFEIPFVHLLHPYLMLTHKNFIDFVTAS